MSRRTGSIEIVAIGEELLNGSTVDTNAAEIGRRLAEVGIRVVRKTTVGDAPDAIADAVRSALERTGAVITTGGLGPTRDDTSRAAVSSVFGRRLQFNEQLWRELESRWTLRGKIPESNRAQAQVPEGATILPNSRGTAAGLAIDDEELGLCVMLPGPPHEVAAMLRDVAVEYIAARLETKERPFVRVLRTAGMAESAIADTVATHLDELPLEVAYLPRIYGVDIRLTAWADDESRAVNALDDGDRRLRQLIGSNIYAEGETDLADVVAELLRARGLTLAVAESCTAGLLGGRLTERSGASDFFWGGLIVYADRAKVALLGVSPDTLREAGAVSEETAREMVEGARRRSGADAAIAITGIAGPEGGTPEKPVGTVWLAVAVGDEVEAKRRRYPGARDMVRTRATEGALDLLRRLLTRETA